MNRTILAELSADDGAIEPSRHTIVIAALMGCVWLRFSRGAWFFPLGVALVLLRLGTWTGATTLRGKLKHGKKVLLAAAATALIGHLLDGGLRFSVF